MKAEVKSIFAISLVALFAGCVTQPRPDYDTLISHRGESIDAPENTLPAFKTAVSRGFGFECDIYRSKDGRFFTFHDGNLKRTTNGEHTERCTEASWRDVVSQVNVGGWGKWKGSKFDPTHPALLEDVLALARDGRKIYIEVKGDNPEWADGIKAVFARQKNATPENVLFIAFGPSIARALKEKMPEYKLYFLLGARRKWEKGSPYWTAQEVLDWLRKTNADGIDICFDPKVHDAEFVNAIKSAGYEFHVWTIDNLANTEKAFAVGAQTVTTNCAKKILDEFEAKAK